MVVKSSHQYSLEITKGKTEFPIRPIQDQRLTIGAGSCCGLQLGGHDMPILHTVIQIDDQEALIRAISPQPKLLLNGTPIHGSTLSDGDHISIGPLEFVFRLTCAPIATNISNAGLSGSPFETSVHITPDKRDHSMTNETTLKDLSASELIDLIEQDFQLIEQFESRREQGAAALLSHIRQTKEDQDEQLEAQESLSDLEQFELLSDLEGMMEELTKFSEVLHQRADQLTTREKQYEVAAASLLETQEKLASQLDRTLDHVGTIKNDQKEDGGSQRAIA
ncbi:FHA domain-containing protein [uncultured Gimesia sp.]|mgnify:CR=1 FL=1|uniref:FHA domain-containing protein n=1 Tax=uncultured Gimesia sp. TaxID=1678688 RepID=UPI002630447D|nr:FHA domain-containing protein [uncultured Gimesia sp.]